MRNLTIFNEFFNVRKNKTNETRLAHLALIGKRYIRNLFKDRENNYRLSRMLISRYVWQT